MLNEVKYLTLSNGESCIDCYTWCTWKLQMMLQAALGMISWQNVVSSHASMTEQQDWLLFILLPRIALIRHSLWTMNKSYANIHHCFLYTSNDYATWICFWYMWPILDMLEHVHRNVKMSAEPKDYYKCMIPVLGEHSPAKYGLHLNALEIWQCINIWNQELSLSLAGTAQCEYTTFAEYN